LDQQKVIKIVTDLLLEIGEDTDREGLISTPKRVAKAYEFLTSGYNKNIEEVLNKAVFTVKYDEMVVVKNIDFYVTSLYVNKVTVKIILQPTIKAWVKPNLIENNKLIFQTTISERPF